jgi:archaeosine synthase alpha-subunit
VTRVVDRPEGLAILGSASVGALHVPTPSLLESRTAGESGPGVHLLSEGGPSGTRLLRLSDGIESMRLELPVLAPEVTAGGPSVFPVGERAWLVHAPATSAELAELKGQRPDLLILGNGRALWSEGEPFVTAIRQIRGEVGAGPLLWAPRVARPHRIALLSYLGIDLVDTVEGRFDAAHGVYVDATFGPVEAPAFRRERRCPCAGCSADPPGDLDAHAVSEYRRAIAETRAALSAGRLRELVESRLTAEPAMAEILRYADRHLATLLEQRAAVAYSGSSTYVLAESHRRPEMVRFRRRLIERYRPPVSKSVLLLVPCSKTKPYRNSRSHRRFLGALEGIAGLERVHVVSVSSPIGLVPRELEDVPPARHYDIPVTGDWSESERAMVEEAFDHLVRSGSYRSAIVHLDSEEYGFLRGRFPPELPSVWTVPDGRTTSPAALDALRAAAGGALESVPSVPGGPLAVVREELRELASVQFGRGAAERLFAPPVRLAGRPWFQRLTDGKSDLATVREERGLFHLTVAGARRLAPEFPLAVAIDPTLSLAGDLFVPGVRSADPLIRAGDSVVLLRDGDLAGVGEAALPGPMMTELARGVAVRVRHREHRPTDTPKSEE